MSAPPLKTFRVFFHEWIVWRTEVEATSAKEAEAMAVELWKTDGHEAFYFFNNGNDGATAEER
jgi:hypothetical protein